MIGCSGHAVVMETSIASTSCQSACSGVTVLRDPVRVRGGGTGAAVSGVLPTFPIALSVTVFQRGSGTKLTHPCSPLFIYLLWLLTAGAGVLGVGGLILPTEFHFLHTEP